MDIFLIILALLSIGLGLGIMFAMIWEIIKKIFSLKIKSNIDAIITIAIISSIFSRTFLQINSSIIYNFIVAIGAIIISAIFLKNI